MQFPKSQAYENVINAFIEHFGKYGRVLTYPKSSKEWFTSIQSGDVAVPRWTFDVFLHFPEWKIRKKTVHILMQAQETIDKRADGFIVFKARLLVSYFDIGENCKLLHSVHYDFGPQENRHPLFHAQLTSDYPEVPPDGVKELDIWFEPEGHHEFFKAGRIPTSNMTLPSALVCIAADHCNDEDVGVFNDFRERLAALRGNMQYADASIVEAAIANSDVKTLCSSCWY